LVRGAAVGKMGLFTVRDYWLAGKRTWRRFRALGEAAIPREKIRA
jgi:hypothetical protein